MRIDVWSDVVCPWCWLGNARLEKALAAFPHREEVELVFRSFELDPRADKTLDIPTERFGAAVRADEALARELGISGVPFFLVDGELAASGAQSVEVLGELLAEGFSKSTPG